MGMLLGHALLSQRDAEALNLKLAEGADDSGGLILIPSTDPRGVQASTSTRKIQIGTPPPVGEGAAGRLMMAMGGPRPAAAAPRQSAPAPRPAAAAAPRAQVAQQRKRADDDASTSRAASGAPAKRPKTSAKARDAGMGAFEAKECMGIIEKLLVHPKSYWFREPVDALQLPDYALVIQSPMDLGTVKARLEDKAYDELDEFAEDVRQVWRNCKTYNQPGSDAYRKGEDLEALFERKLEALRGKLEQRAANGVQPRRASTGGGGKGGGGADMAAMKTFMTQMAAVNPMMAAAMGMVNPLMMMQQMMAANGMGGMAGMGGMGGMGMAANGMGGMGGMGMGCGMGGMGGMAAGGGMAGMGGMMAQQQHAAPDEAAKAPGGGGGKAASKPKAAREPMTFQAKRDLTVQIQKLTAQQVRKVAEIIKRDAPHMVGTEDEADIDLDRLDESTLAKLQDYVATCKNVNAKRKAPSISKAQMLGAAKGLAHENKHKISALHGRGATFGAQPYMEPVMPRPMPGVAPVTASRGTGSRIAPGGFPMPAQMQPKSASFGGPPPRPANGAGGDDSSDSSEPLAHAAPARPALGGRLPPPLGGLKPSGALGGKGLNAAWGSLAQSKTAATAAPGQSQTWHKALAARKASVAHEEQAAQDQAAAQREREAKAAQAIDKHREAEAQKLEAAKAAVAAAERRADDEREAARAAARAERAKIAADADGGGGGGYSFDDFNQFS